MTFKLIAGNGTPPTIRTLNADERAHVVGGLGKHQHKPMQITTALETAGRTKSSQREDGQYMFTDLSAGHY